MVDVQEGFGDPCWGRRGPGDAEANIDVLLDVWRRHGQPVVLVRHDSVERGSPLAPGRPGNRLQRRCSGPSDLLVTKSVNSAFHGSPDLDGWLRSRGIGAVAVCGLTTNHCCETTARVGGNLGYDVWFVLDATATFDRTGPDGRLVPAETLMQVTAANLHGEFAEVVDTRTATAALRPAPSA